MSPTQGAVAIPGYRRVNDLDSPRGADLDESKHDSPHCQRTEAFDLAHRLALRIHELVKTLPDLRQPEFSQQLCTAAATIAAKLSADPAASDPATFQDSLRAARSTATEISYQLLLIRDLGHITTIQYSRLRTDYLRVTQMLTRLIRDR
jgi:four helix bundle protein